MGASDTPLAPAGERPSESWPSVLLSLSALGIAGKKGGWPWMELLVASDVSDKMKVPLCGFVIDRELEGDWSKLKLCEALLVRRARCLPATSTFLAALLISTLGIRVTT